jgi:signal peptidase I
MEWIIWVAAMAGVLVVVRRCLTVVRVNGASMEPTYRTGDQLLVRCVWRASRLRRGQVVVVAPPIGNDVDSAPEFQRRVDFSRGGRIFLVKRVAATSGDIIPAELRDLFADQIGRPVPHGWVVLLGDNPARSVDSRQEGLIANERVRGVVVRKLS